MKNAELLMNSWRLSGYGAGYAAMIHLVACTSDRKDEETTEGEAIVTAMKMAVVTYLRAEGLPPSGMSAGELVNSHVEELQAAFLADTAATA